MYKNYRNTSSQRSENGQWIYMNGELYHWGIKGMKWGKHLPGTDWWKETTKQNLPGWSANGPSFMDKVKANLKTAGQAFNAYKGMTGKAANYYKTDAMSKATSAYGQNRAKNAEMIDGKTRLTHLEQFMNDQIDDAKHYVDELKNNKSGMNVINLAIQNAQFNFVRGVNSFLNRIGMADKVDNFISKFIGKSERIKETAANDIARQRRQDEENANRLDAKRVANSRRNDEKVANALSDTYAIGRQRRQDNSNVEQLDKNRILRENALKEYKKMKANQRRRSYNESKWNRINN